MKAHEPKIEITYDLDANGILKITATEKSTGKSNNLVINSDKNRLSKEEIEKKIKEAELFKEEDQRNADKADAKNILENYCYSSKRTLDEEKLKAEFTEEEKTNVLKQMNDTLQWISSNTNATIEEYKSKQKECEDLFNPIMQRVYAKTGETPKQDNPMGGMGGFDPNMFNNMDPEQLKKMAENSGVDMNQFNDMLNKNKNNENKDSVNEVD